VGAGELDVLVARVGALDLGLLVGVGEVVDDVVEEHLDADVAEGGPTEDGVAGAGDGALAEGELESGIAGSLPSRYCPMRWSSSSLMRSIMSWRHFWAVSSMSAGMSRSMTVSPFSPSK